MNGGLLSRQGGGPVVGAPIVGATEGSVLFAGPAGVLAQDNAKFFWDDANDRLGIGNSAPTVPLDVTGTARVTNAVVTAMTLGSLLFAGAAGAVTQKNAKLFWDNTNDRLGVGNAAPTTALDVTGTTRTTNATITAMTVGSVLFAGVAGAVSQDNAKFFWDDTNKRLGIGNAAPTVPLEVTGTTRTTNATITAMTAGSLLFAGVGGAVSQSNAQLFWDNSGNLLGLGTATPGVSLGFVADIMAEFKKANHAFLCVDTTTANSDAGLFLATLTVNEDAAIFLDESDSRKLKFATGTVNDDTARLAATRMVIQQGGQVGIGTTTVTGVQAHILNATAGQSVLAIQNTNATGFSSINFLNTAGTFILGIGRDNANSANYVDLVSADLNFYSTADRMRLVHQGAFEWTSNGGAGTAAATKARLALGSNKLQLSQGSSGAGAGYFDVATYAAALTTGSVLFANGSNQLTQDNANLFWDDTNNRLGVGTTSPSVSLSVRTSHTGDTNVYVTNTSTSGYSGVAFGNTSNAIQGSIGFGNSAVGITHFQGLNFHWSGGPDWVIGTSTANEHRFGVTNGSAFYALSNGQTGPAAASIAGTARFKYNNTAKTMELSLDTAAYAIVGTYAAAPVSGQVLFATVTTGKLAQSANLFWDNGNNRLGVGTAAPQAQLHVVGGSRFDAQLDLSNIAAGSSNIKITATSDTPTVTWGAAAGNEASTAPAGYLEILVGASVRYIPFWA